MKDSLNVSILGASQNDASDVTSWRYSRFQGKMTIPGYQFGDSLQFMHRKCENNAFENSDTFDGWLCDFLFWRLFC